MDKEQAVKWNMGFSRAQASPNMANAAISSFAYLSLLLLLGKTLRVKIKLIRDLYLPSSVVGGMLGLVINQLLMSYGGPRNCVEDTFPVHSMD
jgi:Na+/glutamate symporter